MDSWWRQVPNALSLSRVVGAVAFLLTYTNADLKSYAIAVTIAIIAIITDFLDGYLARRWGVASEFGYFLDGLGDKTFYFAVLIVMTSEGASTNFLAWLLIAREVVLYALRALDRNRAKNLRRLRALSRYHALFIRLYFLCFLLRDGTKLMAYHTPVILHYGDVFGYIAVALGYISIVIQTRSIVRES